MHHRITSSPGNFVSKTFSFMSTTAHTPEIINFSAAVNTRAVVSLLKEMVSPNLSSRWLNSIIWVPFAVRGLVLTLLSDVSAAAAVTPVCSLTGDSGRASAAAAKETALRCQDSSHPSETFSAAPLPRKSSRTRVNEEEKKKKWMHCKWEAALW